MKRHTILGLVLVAMIVICTSGCTTHTRKMVELRPMLTAGNVEGALLLVDKGMGKKETLLAELERGLILHHDHRWDESNVCFERAERLAEELYGTSISESAVSLFTNAAQKSYRARPFELAMVPYYRALNYLFLGYPDEAMVEVRKASLLLANHIDATLGAIDRGDTRNLARTRSDPFLLYLAGMFYDWDGELNDAFISYRNAAVAYQDLTGLLGVQIPPWLGQDLERVAARLGFVGELDQLRESCPSVFRAAGNASSRSPGSDRGELILFVENGWIAAKGEWSASVPIYKGDRFASNPLSASAISKRIGDGRVIVRKGAKTVYWLPLALPTEPKTDSESIRAVIRGAGQTARSVRVHHPSANAVITADAEWQKVVFETALRALAKYVTYLQAKDKGGFLGGLASNIFNAATEIADTRSWLSLPDEIQMVRVSLPEGVHELEMRLEDTSGRTLGTVLLPPVTVRAGDWTFLSHRVYD